MRELLTKEKQKIREVIPKTNGIFSHMNYTFRAEVTKANLDLLFFTNYGLRSPSPVVDAIQETAGSKLTNEELDILAASILEMYKSKWDKLGAIYDIEYDPIHNYLDEYEEEKDGTRNESESDDSTRTDTYGHTVGDTNLRTDNLTETVTYGRTETRLDNLTETEDATNGTTGTGSGSNNLYGFNSATAVGHDTSSSSDSSTETIDREVHNTGTQSNTSGGSDATANSGTRTDARTINNSGSDTRTLDDDRTSSMAEHGERSGRHSGNIGNLTSQKQILEEISLWRWNYMKEILNDVKEFCTLPLYRM